MTNFERIKAMTATQLAKEMNKAMDKSDICIFNFERDCSKYKDCKECCKAFLVEGVSGNEK